MSLRDKSHTQTLEFRDGVLEWMDGVGLRLHGNGMMAFILLSEVMIDR